MKVEIFALVSVCLGFVACHEKPGRPNQAVYRMSETRHASPPPRAISVLSPMVDREYYSCCVLHFNASGEATDANYNYLGGLTIPLGTRLRVVAAGDYTLTFESLENPGRTLLLRFSFGRKRWNAEEYFHTVLRDTDPRLALADATPAVTDAIAHGHLLVGMTKAQAIMARGYPPMHHTAGVGADEWLYYEAPTLVTRATFSDGHLQSLEAGAAP